MSSTNSENLVDKDSFSVMCEREDQTATHSAPSEEKLAGTMENTTNHAVSCKITNENKQQSKQSETNELIDSNVPVVNIVNNANEPLEKCENGSTVANALPPVINDDLKHVLVDEPLNIFKDVQQSTSTDTESLVKDIGSLEIAEQVVQNNRSIEAAVILNKQTDSLRNLMLYESSEESDDSDFERDWQIQTMHTPVISGSSKDNDSDSEANELIFENSDEETEVEEEAAVM